MTEKTAEIEQRADRAVELEERLRDARDEVSEPEPDAEYDLRISTEGGLLFDDGVRRATVLAVEQHHSRVRVTFVPDDGEETCRTIPFPDDPTDPSEPLVRLCNWAGVKVDRVGDLNEVPIVETGRGWRIYVPKGSRQRTISVTLPGGRQTRFQYTSLLSRCNKWIYRIMRAFVASPAVNGGLGGYDVPPIRGIPAILLMPAVVSGVLFSLAFHLSSTALAMVALLSVFVVFLSMAAMIIELDVHKSLFDTY